jgi:hypothetical protein
MRRSAIVGIFLIVPALLVMTAAPGCGKKDQGKKGDAVDAKKAAPEDKKGGGDGAKTALDAMPDAVVKGQVTYDGDPPKSEFIEAMSKHENKATCLAGDDVEKNDQKWIVNKSNKGVANVVVWLEPPAGKFFKLSDADKKRTDEVSLHQPHCAFIPHVVALFPEYKEGDKLVKTGQIFVAYNDAGVNHNTRVAGNELKNPQKSVTIPPKGKHEFPIKYQGQSPIKIGCDIHSWMNALALTFDNPYHAVTDQDGNFKIENVPSGVELTVVAWHEVPGKFKTAKETFKAGDNTFSPKVSK